jgi:transposase
MVIQDMKTLEDALAVIRELTSKLQELTICNARLMQENAWLKRQIFESRSEKQLPVSDTTEFLPGLEIPAVEEAPQEIQQVESHQRKVREKNGWDEIPEGLPTEEIIIDVPEAEREGMELIGYDESKRIAWRSGLYVKVIKRAKYADKTDTLRGVVTAPPAGDYFDTLSGKTKFDVSFTAKVVSDKVENALPLDRQAKIFAREGFPVSSSTLGHLFNNTALALVLLYNRMVEIIMENEILHVDETFMKLLIPGRGKCKQVFLWCRMTGTGPPLAAFHFNKSRSKEVAKLLLGNYSGTIIRDDYNAYHPLKCKAACCWAHLQRRLKSAYDKGYVRAIEPREMVRKLYKIEADAKEIAQRKGTETALFQARRAARVKSRKIVDDLFKLCRSLRDTDIPDSPVYTAVNYALNIETELRRFLDDSKLNIDNNPAERLNMTIAISRRNWLFTSSEEGGQNLAIIFSFSETCKANNVNFRFWLEDVLPRLNTTPASEIDTLLPHLWKPLSEN